MSHPYVVTRSAANKPGRRKSKWDATTAPTTGDDETQGYGVGSTWLDTVAPAVYICADATTAAAVWVELGGGGTLDYGEDADISDLAFDDVADAGALDEVARADHVHGMPAEPSSGVGEILMTPDITDPPEPMWTDDGTDYLYEDT